MQRKTNIFYLSGQDSNFLTFSNYTECMTGNFLSTDHKMFPTKFMCLNLDFSSLDSKITEEEVINNATLYAINGNNDSNTFDTYNPQYNIKQEDLDNIIYNDVTFSNLKQIFINKLIGKYENKLAFLRDKLIDEDKKPEDYLCPLAYLLEVLKEPLDVNITFLVTVKEEDHTNSSIDVTYKVSINKSIQIIKDNKIPYIGEISEQDYNGTYEDLMCIINMTKYSNWTINNKQENEYTSNKFIYDYTYIDNKNTEDINDDEIKYLLWGWTNDELLMVNTIDDRIDGHINETALFDGEEINDRNEVNYYYDASTKLKSITFNDTDISKDTLKFNIIIPLFSITRIKNTTNIDSNEDNINENFINLSSFENNGNPYNIDVPLGMWITEHQIELKYDNDAKAFPIWSLVISSQFKPFPYSRNIEDNYIIGNETINNDNDNNIKPNAFNTFAQILSNQQTLLEYYNDLNSRLILIESKLSNNNNMNLTNEDEKNQLVSLTETLTTKYNQLYEDVNKALNDLKWHLS